MYKEKIVDNLTDLVVGVLDKALIDDLSVAFIAKYEDAKIIVTNLLTEVPIEIDSIELLSPECDGYDKEYLILIDDSLRLYCEKNVNKDDVALRYDADVVYIMSDCRQKCVKCIDSEKVNVILLSSDIDNCEPDVPCQKCSRYECDNYHVPGERTIKIETNLEPKDVERMLDLFELMIDMEKEFDERFPFLF